MNKYRYIATHREYLDFCLELIALRAISREDHYKVGQKGYSFYRTTYGWFESHLQDVLPSLEEKYNINITPYKLLEIMTEAKNSYYYFNGNLDGYLNSLIIKEFQSICLGNQLDNTELLDFWAELFGMNLTGLQVMSKRDNIDYEHVMPSIFDINDVVALTDKNFFKDYYERAPLLNKFIKLEFPASSVRFIPSKYVSLLYTYLWITESDHLYPTTLEKHKSVFTLLEFIFGELNDEQMLKVLFSVLYVPINRLVPYGEWYNCTKKNFWIKYNLKFGSNKEFSDRAEKSLLVYRAGKEKRSNKWSSN